MLLFRPSIAGDINQLTYSHIMTTSKENKRLLGILLIAVSLLFIPLIAMNFTEEVNWKLGDFLVAGVLLGGASLGLEFILRKTRTKVLKLVLITLLLLALLLVWAEMAVGIFGSPLAGS